MNTCNNTDGSKADIKQHAYKIKSIRQKQITSHDNISHKVKRTLAPTEDNMEITILYLDTHTLRAISKIRHPETWNTHQLNQTNPKATEIPAEDIERMINAIQSKETTTQEQALGFYMRKKLKTLKHGIYGIKERPNNSINWRTYRCLGSQF